MASKKKLEPAIIQKIMANHNNNELLSRYNSVRQASVSMCASLEPETCRIQPSLEISPPWWNLAHTSWFFVRNVLEPFKGAAESHDALFDYVLNSYYVALGPRLEQGRRGLMTRPTMKEVYAYRQSVDKRVEALLMAAEPETIKKLEPIILIGLQHEQQHQELFYSEIKNILYQNPPNLRPVYKKNIKPKSNQNKSTETRFIAFSGGLYEFGNLEQRWCWDNELPIHKFYLNDFAMQNRLVTNGEYLEFMQDGGYKTQLLWLNNGWNHVQQNNWTAPLYWEKIDSEWQIWTLSGMEKLGLQDPVCHISFYEAEAYASWKGLRLPSEQEWEHAARSSGITTKTGNFLNSGYLHPVATHGNGLEQMFGDVWEWTNSYYEPYPGYQPFSGKLREYNEKFMDNQRVIRGGSCVSEMDHIRLSYRNFWKPETRFQFTGVRLAK